MFWIFKILKSFMPLNRQEFVGFCLGLISLAVYFVFLESALLNLLSEFLPIELVNNSLFNVVIWIGGYFIIFSILSRIFDRFFDKFERCLRAFEKDDFETVIKLATPLARKGDDNMQWLLGFAYSNDNCTLRDSKKAIKWLTLAGEQGNEFAQLLLGQLYDDGHEGAFPDYELSVKWYELASQSGKYTENGLDLAQLFLGWKKLNTDSDPENIDVAIRLFKLSAKQGNIKSMGILAALYFDGDLCIQNFSESLKYLKLIIDQDGLDGWAESLVGEIYEKGLGVSVDYEEAFKWYKLGVEKGDKDAMNSLGMMYYYGYGVSKNNSEARRLFELASALGNEYAVSCLDNIDDKNGLKSHKFPIKKQAKEMFEKVGKERILSKNVINFPIRK